MGRGVNPVTWGKSDVSAQKFLKIALELRWWLAAILNTYHKT